MTTDRTNVRASRLHVARSRGALSGVLLVLFGAWAGLVAFIGPYFDFAFTPSPNDAWHWTDARGWLEVLPGAVAVLGGLLLLASTSRLTTSLGAWFGVLAGGWLIVGPALADSLNLTLGAPDPSSSTGLRALEALFFFYATGGAILFVASIGLGRLSVHSLGDVRAAERRAAAEQAAIEQAAAERAASARAEEQREVVEPSGSHVAEPPRRDTEPPQPGAPQAQGQSDPHTGSPVGTAATTPDPRYQQMPPPPGS